jgi:hypothetical protein
MCKSIKQLFSQSDKLKHFIALSAIMEILVTALLFVFPLWANLLISTGVSIVIGLLKEYYDYKHPDTHSAEKADLYAGLIGIGCVNLQWLIFFALYKIFPIFVV